VRDWDATADRYAGGAPVEHVVGDLTYRTETTLDGGLMRIHETYVGIAPDRLLVVARLG
jgi:hypothetical protein